MAFPHAVGTGAKMPDRMRITVGVLSEHSLSKHIRATTLAATQAAMTQAAITQAAITQAAITQAAITQAAMTQAAMLGDDTTIKRSYTSGSDNHTTFVNQNHSCGCIV
jgi:hypothetical protein